MAKFKRVQVGQELAIPAPDWNAAMDAAEDFARRRNGMAGEMIDGQRGGLVLVRNETGGDVAIGAVLGLNGPIIRAADNLNEWRWKPAFKGILPAIDHLGRFVVTVQPIPNGKIGSAVISGVVPALVEMENDGDEYADVIVGDVTKLRSGAGTARLIDVQPRAERADSSIAQCYVQLGAKEWESWVKLTGATAVSGNAHRWKYSGPEQRPTWDGTTLGYSDRSSGQVWTGLIWNPPETNNTNARGLQPSTGVNQTGAAYPAGFDVKPLAAGLVVPIRLRRIATTAGAVTRIPWIVYQNADDGVCS